MGKMPEYLRRIIASNIAWQRKKKFPERGGSKKCAILFGVSPQQWSPWERGNHTPDETRLEQIANFFDVDVAFMRYPHIDNPLIPRDLLPENAASKQSPNPSPKSNSKKVSLPKTHAPAPSQPDGRSEVHTLINLRVIKQLPDDYLRSLEVILTPLIDGSMDSDTAEQIAGIIHFVIGGLRVKNRNGVSVLSCDHSSYSPSAANSINNDSRNNDL